MNNRNLFHTSSTPHFFFSLDLALITLELISTAFEVLRKYQSVSYFGQFEISFLRLQPLRTPEFHTKCYDLFVGFVREKRMKMWYCIQTYRVCLFMLIIKKLFLTINFGTRIPLLMNWSRHIVMIRINLVLWDTRQSMEKHTCLRGTQFILDTSIKCIITNIPMFTNVGLSLFSY